MRTPTDRADALTQAAADGNLCYVGDTLHHRTTHRPDVPATRIDTAVVERLIDTGVLARTPDGAVVPAELAGPLGALRSWTGGAA